jgi:ectoine hydroxylase-related dioxygenase (phytanoyl-CoA dioxygenase family)
MQKQEKCISEVIEPKEFPFVRLARQGIRGKVINRLLNYGSMHRVLNWQLGLRKAMYDREEKDLPLEFRSVLEEIRQNGIAIRRINDLFPAASLDSIRNRFHDMREIYIRGVGPRSVEERSKSTKKDSYLDNLTPNYILSLNDPITQIVINRNLGKMCRAYLKVPSRFVSLNVWNTLPAVHKEKVGSQRWHRDYNDLRMIKIFVYQNDVTAENGPFTYIKKSHYDGSLGRILYRIYDSHKGMRRYPRDKELIPYVDFFEENKVVCTGKAGTVIICDTFGFHSGGYVKLGTRELIMALFASSIQTHPTNFAIEKELVDSGLLDNDIFGV